MRPELPLTDKDKELIDAATRPSSALSQRLAGGRRGHAHARRPLVTGVNLDAYVGRGAVCAEAIAIGRALTEKGDKGIETIVAVRHPSRRARRHRRGVALRRLPRTDPRLRRQGARHRAGRQGTDGASIGELLPNKYRRGMK